MDESERERLIFALECEANRELLRLDRVKWQIGEGRKRMRLVEEQDRDAGDVHGTAR